MVGIMSSIILLLAVLSLLTAIYLNIESYHKLLIKGLSIQSFIIAILFFLYGYINSDGSFYILALSTLFFRAIIVPQMLTTYVKSPFQRSKTNPSIFSITSLFIILLSYYLYSNVFSGFSLIGAIPLALVFLGFFILASRRSTLGKIIGYVVEENGILVLTAFLVPTLPFILEAGVTLDLFGVLIVLVIMKDIKMDINYPELRG